MDTPKQGPFCFVNFPPDIWAYVVWFLSGEQLGRLKMTGTTSLWHKLTFPGVVRSVKLGQDFIQFKSWPAFLNELSSLEELLIFSRRDSWWSEFGLRLDSLPSTLRKLRITGLNAERRDFFVDQQGNNLKLEQHLPRIELLDLRHMPTLDYAWMAHAPPTLTNLSILSWKGDVQLPPSLIHFRTYNADLQNVKVALKLPPGLESFSAHRLLGLDRLVSAFPACLLKLHDLSSETEDFSAAQLPRSMTSLRSRSVSAIASFGSPDTISSLPPTLTKLDVEDELLPSATWPFLPPTLKSLVFGTSDSSFSVISRSVYNSSGKVCELRTLPFDKLPRAITRLTIFGRSVANNLIGPPAEPASSCYFPPQLTHLSMLDLDIAPAVARLLPPSLTLLEIGRLCEQVCQHLPNGLTQLLALSTLMSPNLIRLLPKSLTSLHLSPAGKSDYWHDYNTGQRIKAVSKLPNYALHKNYGTNIDWKDDFSLPPKLTELDLHDFVKLHDTLIVNQKLPNLMSLDLSEVEHITDLSIPLLSRHLTSLILSASQISGKAFPSLPKSLTHLNLDASTSIFDSDIRHLPRTLKVLHMSQATSLSPECLADLPPNLELLRLRMNEEIPSSYAPNMPKLIRSPISAYYEALRLRRWSIRRGIVIE